ncbi:ribosome biogenesis GTPase YqeH [Tuberibacillus sp. Marseille-P3662]|uniref:ribosome biogenesis GTPase YqeH n=1 Tax=Tuberibacillus sp. Marseille-P3662 TaxID=1965358 RepID=UPI000A1CE30C|nr:ribosome biogenesis GTPase YqeH [Tuberibacillus sp. Marseille-P3662]
MTQEQYCSGCGAAIQTDDPKKIGFAPEAALKRETVLCKRCFRLNHYNEVPDVQLSDEDFLNMLETISHTNALVVKIVDIFDFTGSWVPGVRRFAGNNDVMLVGNKLDLLPQSFNQDKLLKWMRFMSNQAGLKPIDVQLISAEKGTHIKELAALIDNYRDGKDVYIVGSTNVGKSTFLNQLIQTFAGDDDTGITASQYPGTTLNFIEIPLDDEQSIYDTPGVINPQQMAHFVNADDLKVITPRKEVKAKIHQLNEGQTLFFGGLARLDFVKGGFCPFVSYVSNELYIHRTKTENAEALYHNHLGELLSPPSDTDMWTGLIRHDFKIKEKNTDIVVSGLGWITVKEAGVTVSVHAPKGVGVSVRRSIIKG